MRPFRLLLPALVLLGCSSAGNGANTGGLGGAGGTSSASGGSGSQGPGSTGGAANVPGECSQSAQATDAQANVYPCSTKQAVDGFGFSTAWGSVPSDANLDAFFSVTQGAGLSILRNRIPFRENPSLNDHFLAEGNYNPKTVGSGADSYKTYPLSWGSWDLAATKALITKLKANPDYQLSAVFSTPWTPPNNSSSRWKTGVGDYVNAPEIGGSLDPAHYADYADLLADYALGFEANMGAPLTALSLQNEPNFKVNYESADWTAAQLKDFLTVLKTEFTKKGVFSKLPGLTLIAPEANNFTEALMLPSLSDSNVSELFGILGGHQYEYGWSADPFSVPAPSLAQSRAAGKRLWMTEWSAQQFLTVSGNHTVNDMLPSLALAKLIHTDFVEHGLNAFIYWWAAALVYDTTSGGETIKSPAKLLWTLGQYSRFIRPGWYRVEASAVPATDLLMSAYVAPNFARTAIVVVNMGSSERSFDITLEGHRFGEVSVVRTSASENMAVQAAPSASGAVLHVTVPAQSVTTYSSEI